MCTVLLPPGVNPVAVNKYIISSCKSLPQSHSRWGNKPLVFSETRHLPDVGVCSWLSFLGMSQQQDISRTLPLPLISARSHGRYLSTVLFNCCHREHGQKRPHINLTFSASDRLNTCSFSYKQIIFLCILTHIDITCRHFYRTRWMRSSIKYVFAKKCG
jgi:hypothetical protein